MCLLFSGEIKKVIFAPPLTFLFLSPEDYRDTNASPGGCFWTPLAIRNAEKNDAQDKNFDGENRCIYFKVSILFIAFNVFSLYLPCNSLPAVGGVAQWLGRQSLASGLSLVYG